MSFRKFKYGWQMPCMGLEGINKKSLLQNILSNKDICTQELAIEICLPLFLSLSLSVRV